MVNMCFEDFKKTFDHITLGILLGKLFRSMESVARPLLQAIQSLYNHIKSSKSNLFDLLDVFCFLPRQTKSCITSNTTQYLVFNSVVCAQLIQKVRNAQQWHHRLHFTTVFVNCQYLGLLTCSWWDSSKFLSQKSELKRHFRRTFRLGLLKFQLLS